MILGACFDIAHIYIPSERFCVVYSYTFDTLYGQGEINVKKINAEEK